MTTEQRRCLRWMTGLARLTDKQQDAITAALARIDALEVAVGAIWPFLEEDAESGCNTPAYAAAIEAVRAVLQPGADHGR